MQTPHFLQRPHPREVVIVRHRSVIERTEQSPAAVHHQIAVIS